MLERVAQRRRNWTKSSSRPPAWRPTTPSAGSPPRAACAASRAIPTDLLDRHLRRRARPGPTPIVKIPSDCPLIDPGVIDASVAFFRARADRYDYVSNLHPATYPDGNDVEVMRARRARDTAREARRPVRARAHHAVLWDQPERFALGNVAWETGHDFSMTAPLHDRLPGGLRAHRGRLRGAGSHGLGRRRRRLRAALRRRSDPRLPRPRTRRCARSTPRIAASPGCSDHAARAAHAGLRDARPTRQPTPPRGGAMSDFGALEAQALRVREHVIRMATERRLLHRRVALVRRPPRPPLRRVLRVSPRRSTIPTRDYLLLSKGHDVPALYGTLAELGYFATERLENHLTTTTTIYWHPNRAIPGVEFHSGSLGHLLSVGIGDRARREDARRDVARLRRPRRRRARRRLDLGGAARRERQKLDNLVVDRRPKRFQANIGTEELIPLEPLADKFARLRLRGRRRRRPRLRRAGAGVRGCCRSSGQADRVIAEHRARQGPAQHRARAPIAGSSIFTATRSRCCSRSCTAARPGDAHAPKR